MKFRNSSFFTDFRQIIRYVNDEEKNSLFSDISIVNSIRLHETKQTVDDGSGKL